MAGDLGALLPPAEDLGAGAEPPSPAGPDAGNDDADGAAPADGPADGAGAADAAAPRDGALRDQTGLDFGGGPTCAACAAYGEPFAAGSIGSTAINEVSGMAASAANPGFFYVHNDSGDSARFFAIDDTGGLVGEFQLSEVIARDWEDMAVGPCGAESCVYVGEIGDNDLTRGDYVIYRVPEPKLTAQPLEAPVTLVPERFPFVYPDGAHNAETLLVHPQTGDVYVVTKVSLPALPAVYRFPRPLVPDEVATLEKVGDLDVTEACASPLTGGDIHPCGDRVLLRSRGKACELRLPPGMPFDSVFSAAPVNVPLALEGQGEAVTYARDGLSYVTLSEGVLQPLNRVACR